MSIKEIYETDLWKKLSKNQAFNTKFYEIVRRTKYYFKDEDMKVSIDGDTLTVSYSTPVQNRDDYSQEVNETIFELSLDSEDNLLFNEKSITIRSDDGYDFEDSKKGTAYTQYVCSLYDPEGIELLVQIYTDRYHLNKHRLNNYMNDLTSILNGEFNPSLVYFNSVYGMFPKPATLGDSSQYVRRTRSIDNLGLVDSVECSFSEEAAPIDFKHEYYFNTFKANKFTFQPEVISIIAGNPFATIDDNNFVHINRSFSYMNLTLDNYKDVARKNFLDELKADQEYLSTVDIKAKYDFMISKLEDEKENRKGTR